MSYADRIKSLARAGVTSWKTTLCGALIFAQAVIQHVAEPLLDSLPETSPDWMAFTAASLAFAALWNARDHGVSSERAGAHDGGTK